MSFAVVEETLKALAEKQLGNAAHVDVLPGDLRDAKALRELVRHAPAVYFAFLGGNEATTGNDLHLKTVWGVYFVTKHANKRDARRLGDKSAIGAYEMMRRILPAMNGLTIEDVGSLTFKRLNNLFSLSVDSESAALYAATFDLPMTLALELHDADSINQFLSYTNTMSAGADVPPTNIDTTFPE